MSTKYANCSFQNAITDFYSNRLARGLSLAVPFAGLIRASTIDMLYEDFIIHFPTKPRPTDTQAQKIISNCAGQARNGCEVNGPNRGNLLEKNSKSATYIADSNAKWNPINNAINNPIWNPINNRSTQLRIAEENRIRLEEMHANGEIADLPRSHDELRIIVDSVFLEFERILLFNTVYVGYTGVSLAVEPFRY